MRALSISVAALSLSVATGLAGVPAPATATGATAAGAGPTGAAATVGSHAPEARPATTQQVLRQGLRRVVNAGAVGVTAHVYDRGAETFGTFGDAQLNPSRPASGDPVFRAASVTKTLVAVLAFQQVQAGRWTLGTTIGDVLPDLWPARSGLTLGQLLSHRSGLPEYEDAVVAGATTPRAFKDAISKRRSEASLVRLVRQMEPVGEPGERFSYSNINYVIVGMMLHKATGKKLGDLLAERVLQPARMTRSRYATDSRLALSAATPRLREYAPIEQDGRQVDLSSFSPTLYAGAGALVSTARDLDRFQRALSRGVLLRKALVRTMRSVVSSPDEAGVGYGYGSFRVDDPCVPGGVLHGHDGSSFATMTLSFSSPSGSRQVTVAMTGREYTEEQPAYQALNRLVFELFATTCDGSARPAGARTAVTPWS